ncbi:MAG: class II aldolase/adducin family protein [Coriobacteriia bacterium]|nr:class II aldolase/adducin family protein [Coriobacteriia bacterium]MCL2746110.1 class II aldolase/adducin family protein [Coriobacteriia bacterium]MCL2870279.1 class II aldolase/adducin family protein [Coriobacteriia bacterium]
MTASYFNEIQELGRDLFVSGLISSHGGNVSVLDASGKHIHITRTGSALGRLRDGDVVAVGYDLPRDEAALTVDKQASIELVVHRALYHALPDTRAVVHAHSLFTTLLSLKQDSIEPLDSEAKHFIPRVPVLDVEETIASDEVAEQLPLLMRDMNCPVAVIKGHGPFAVGKDLDEAWRYISILEMSSRMIHEYGQA